MNLTGFYRRIKNDFITIFLIGIICVAVSILGMCGMFRDFKLKDWIRTLLLVLILNLPSIFMLRITYINHTYTVWVNNIFRVDQSEKWIPSTSYVTWKRAIFLETWKLPSIKGDEDLKRTK